MIDDAYLKLLQRELVLEFNPSWIYYLQSKQDFSNVRNQGLLIAFKRYLEVVNKEITEEYLNRLAGFANTASAAQFRDFPEVAVGIVWTDDLNACALQVGDTEYGILLNHMPFIVMPALFRLTTDTFTSIGHRPGPFSNEAEFHAHIQHLSTFGCDSFEASDASAVDRLTRILSTPPSSSDLACATIAAEFIVLHEFSHIGLGHLELSTSRRTRLRMSPSGNSVDAISYSHEHEFDADEAALDRLFAINEERSSRLHDQRHGELLMCLVHLSVTLLFIALHIKESQGSRNDRFSHPSSIQRMRRFHEKWSKYNNTISELLIESIERAPFISS